MIQIRKSPTADTRTCDFANVTPETLLASSKSHIVDVQQGMAFFAGMLLDAAAAHDHDKITGNAWFHADFVTGFKQTGWWDNHRKINRHHLNYDDGIPADVNLLDLLEYLTDCVMAGMARSGSVYDIVASPELLDRAFKNTVELLKANVEVAEGEVEGVVDPVSPEALLRRKYDAATRDKAAAQAVINAYHSEKREIFQARWKAFRNGETSFTDAELIYASLLRCSCGAGMAHPKECGGTHQWDCSSVLRGEADSGEHDNYPFALYDIKSEIQPSAMGHSTRPLPPGVTVRRDGDKWIATRGEGDAAVCASSGSREDAIHGAVMAAKELAQEGEG